MVFIGRLPHRRTDIPRRNREWMRSMAAPPFRPGKPRDQPEGAVGAVPSPRVRAPAPALFAKQYLPLAERRCLARLSVPRPSPDDRSLDDRSLDCPLD